jgi:hypothetical protein
MNSALFLHLQVLIVEAAPHFFESPGLLVFLLRLHVVWFMIAEENFLSENSLKGFASRPVYRKSHTVSIVG